MASIARQIDDLGRIYIPKEFRRKLSIETGDSIEIEISENGIYLKKSLTKEEKREKWVREILSRKDRYDRSVFTFTTKFVRNITILILTDWEKRMNYTSYAFCLPKDKFDEKVGIAVAYARMFDIDVPDYI